MASMTKAQKVMMNDFHQKFFALQERYWNPEDTDDYWDKLTDDAMDLLEQFHTSDAALNSYLSNVVADFLNSREEIRI